MFETPSSGILVRPVRPGDDGIACDDCLPVMTASSMLRHHAPVRDHGLAHLPGVLRAGDLADLHRNFLADKAFQLRRRGLAAGYELERLRSGFEIAQSVRRRQPARLTGAPM